MNAALPGHELIDAGLRVNLEKRTSRYRDSKADQRPIRLVSQAFTH
jgi:hypothetical protein